MANIFDGADCGPSNALSSVVKHAEVDRSLQRVRGNSIEMATHVLTGIVRIALEDLPRLRYALLPSLGADDQYLKLKATLASSFTFSSPSRCLGS